MGQPQCGKWAQFRAHQEMERKRHALSQLKTQGGPAARMWADQVTYRIVRTVADGQHTIALVDVQYPGFPSRLWRVRYPTSQSPRDGVWAPAPTSTVARETDQMNNDAKLLCHARYLTYGQLSWDHVKWSA